VKLENFSSGIDLKTLFFQSGERHIFLTNGVKLKLSQEKRSYFIRIHDSCKMIRGAMVALIRGVQIRTLY